VGNVYRIRFKLTLLKTVLIVLFLCFILAFVSCSTKDNADLTNDFTQSANDSTRVYSDFKGASLNIINSVWFTTTTNSNSFGQVNLAISGSTNADKVTVMTYGDGVLYEKNIQLVLSKGFTNDTTWISFTHFSGTLPTTGFEISTIIKAYKGSDTLMVTLNSGKLKS
jgi:hypothetical protein